MSSKVLLITGDFWHPPGPYHNYFQNLLNLLGVPLHTVVKNDLVPWSCLKDYKLIILNKEGRNSENILKSLWLSIAEEKLLAEYLSSGGNILGLHNGTCEYHDGGPVREFMKGHFREHPPLHEFNLVPLPHSFTEIKKNNSKQTIGSDKIFDELYQLDINKEQTTVFLESDSPYSKEIAGWTHPWGAGQFVGFTLGHTGEVLQNAVVYRILQNIIGSIL